MIGATASVPAVELRGLDAPAAPGVARLALRGLDLRLAAGEQVAVIGASGAGKTSLLQVLGCAVPPSGGELSLLGHDPWRISAAARRQLRGRLCLAPQQAPLPPRQRVVTAVLAGRLPQQNLWQSLRTLWHPPEAEARQAQAALLALDLPDKLWQRVDRLSGGERQRVGLARLLVSGAELWLADEPLAALDPARAERVIQHLTRAARERGATLVCSLHQVEIARRCFGRIVALREGRLVHDGPAAQLTPDRLHALYGDDLPSLYAQPAEATAADGTPPANAALPQSMCR